MKFSIKRIVFAVIFLNCMMMLFIISLWSTNRRTVCSSRTKPTATLEIQAKTTGLRAENITMKDNGFDAVLGDMTESWQPFDNSPNSHYVYSAYLHNTGSKPTIKIIGVMCKSALNSPIYCHLRYRDSLANVSVVSVRGSGKPLREGYEHKYVLFSSFFFKGEFRVVSRNGEREGVGVQSNIHFIQNFIFMGNFE